MHCVPVLSKYSNSVYAPGRRTSHPAKVYPVRVGCVDGMVRVPSYTQLCADCCTVIFSFSLYHRNFISFGCQSADRFELPLYVSSVVLVHGADALFDAIPDANESVEIIIINKIIKNRFMFIPFFLLRPCRGANSPPEGEMGHEVARGVCGST